MTTVPSMLIAMPSLKESIFSRSVILMGEKGESGALGLILNMPTQTTVNDALKMMQIKHERSLEMPILFGGPVQTDFFWMLHSPEFKGRATIQIDSKVNLSPAVDIIPILDEEDCPYIYHAGVGYSGWGINQLERETEEGTWWLCEWSEEIFFSTPFQNMWNTAIKNLGVDPERFIDFGDSSSSPSIN